MTDDQNADPQLAGMMQHWQNLHTQAENGALRMDPELGAELKRHVGELIKQLEEQLRPAERLKFVTGFGGLKSAQALQQKFANKAVTDDDSAVNRLKQAIDIAKLMEDTYSLAIGKIEETDQSTAAALGNAGEQ
ncbi:hypothetical protein [Nocardia paucivorans]|uniref:hypothetical protein n=1 Tax=Nocardia paucivorans TaxID=114259 RepID=UPI0006849296|nr:hypothetical protein [Nocardia paucivorans]